MRIELRCDPVRPRAWIERAAIDLAGVPADVSVVWADKGNPAPTGLASLFELERVLLRKGKASGIDPVARDAIVSGPQHRDPPDVVVDFTSEPRDPASTARLYLRPLYNGDAGEDGALQAILAGDLPLIEIYNEIDGAIVDHGWPSSEMAAGLSGNLDTVIARTMTLLNAIISGSPRLPARIAHRQPRKVPKDAASYVFAGLAHAVAKRIYRMCCYAPHWRIGWRYGDAGGVWKNGDLSGAPWREFADPGLRSFADPFPITWQGRTFTFFEDLDHRVGKGTISAIEFDGAGPIGPVVPVLEERWHLSYPFVIADGGELWMIPESSAQRDVALYRCISFPDKWERHATLLTGVELADATVTRHNGLYYMSGVVRDGTGGYSDTLAIYYAERLTGPWSPHASNPILIDRSAARPAGNFVNINGALWRPVQDCADGYGAALALAEVIELSPTSFKQIVRHRIQPGPNWTGRKLHTLNTCGRLELIDGSRIQPKITAQLRSAQRTFLGVEPISRSLQRQRPPLPASESF